jgi:hypothetical protein
MKIAVCICGEPRNYKNSFETIKKSFLKDEDCDFYFHTWNNEKFTSTNFGFGQHEYSLSEDSYKEIIDLYQPINYKIENPILFDASGYKCPIWRQPLNNTLSMYYSIYQTFLLIDKNIEYDYVVRTRFDIDYTIFNPIFNNKLQIPIWHNTDKRCIHRGVDDNFAMGSYDDIKRYSSLFCYAISYITNNDEYFNSLSGGWPGQGSPLRNEYLLKWHLESQKVDYETFLTKNKGIIR